jgi:hypothetical protein
MPTDAPKQRQGRTDEAEVLSIAACRVDSFRPPGRSTSDSVSRLLAEAGHRVAQLGTDRLDLDAYQVVLLRGSANWWRKISSQVAVRPKSERPLIAMWQIEPLPPPRAAGLGTPRLHLREIVKILLRDSRATDVYTNYLALRRMIRRGLIDLLMVSSQGRREFLAERGIASEWVPLGYVAERDGRDLNLQRDIQVLFLGDLRVPRRKRQIRYLRRRGIDVRAVGSWNDPAYWGENRTRLLNRTKILLNVQRYPGEPSSKRLVLGIANGALVISEPIYKPAPFVPGKHYVSASLQEMPDLMRYYLDREKEREQLVEEGQRLVTQEFTMERSVALMLELIRERLRKRGGEGVGQAGAGP